MKRLIVIALILGMIGVCHADTTTSNYGLTKPSRGSQAWDTKMNTNMSTIDSALYSIAGGLSSESSARITADNELYQQILLKYGDVVARLGSLPEVYVETGTFNGSTGRTITLPKNVSAITEYAVAVEPSTRGAAIGDIHVEQATTNFSVKCVEANTSDTFKALIFYREDTNPYGTSIHRKWYVSPLDAITDHSDNTTSGSLAWVIAQVGGYYADVELPGNHSYSVDGNLTIPANVHLIFQEGAVLDRKNGSSRLTINGPMSGPISAQRFDDNTTIHNWVLFGNNVIEDYAEWWGTVGTGGDDSSQFASAVLAFPENGGIVQTLAKDYKFNIEISTQNITMRGVAGGQFNLGASAGKWMPFDTTKPVIKVYGNGSWVLRPVRLENFLLNAGGTSVQSRSDNSTISNPVWLDTGQIGIQLAGGSYGSQLNNFTIRGFTKHGLLIGDLDAAMISPITSIDVTNFHIWPENKTGNCVTLAALAGNASSWITGVRFSHGLMSTNHVYKMSTWSGNKTYAAGAIVSAVDDHNPDNSNDDWGFVWRASSACISGSAEPVWNLTVGSSATPVDGNCTWVTHQRGRDVWDYGASFNIADMYIEPSHFGGIRFENSGTWGGNGQFSNVNLMEGSVTAVYMENRIDSYDTLYHFYGALRTSGYYKCVGRKAYDATNGTYNLTNITGAYGYTTNLSEVYIRKFGREVSDPWTLIRQEDDNNLTISNFDHWPISGGKYDIYLQKWGYGNVRIRGGGYNTPHLRLGDYHLWIDGSDKLRIKNGEPTSATDGTIVGSQ
jgi:hypothetical protein